MTTADNKAGGGYRRLDSIDALRGWAAFLVIAFHVAAVPQPNLSVPKWLFPIVFNGGTGVILFFVLSAFSLGYAWQQQKQTKSPEIAFYLRRFFRIAPLFYFWVPIVLAQDLMLNKSHPLSQLFLSSTFLFNLFPGEEQGIVPASWTLGVEMPFYLVFPLLIATANTPPKAALLYLLSLIVANLWSKGSVHLGLEESIRIPFVFTHIIYNLPNFILGMVLFLTYEKSIKYQINHKAIRRIALLGAISLYAVMLQDSLARLIPGILFWQGVAHALLMVSAVLSHRGVLVNSVMIFLGTISYSLYLNHLFVIHLLEPLYRKIYLSTWPSLLSYSLCLVITLVLVITLSMLTYRFIEVPGIRYGKKIIRRWSLR